MNYKHIAFDFDGTILGSNHKISKNLLQLFSKLIDEGYMLIPASGRNISQMIPYLKQMRIFSHDTFVLSDNGASLYKVTNGELNLIRQIKFSKEEVRILYNKVSHYTRDFVAYHNGECRYEKLTLRERIRSHKFKRILKKGIDIDSTKLILLDNSAKISEIYEKCKGDVFEIDPLYNVFRSVPSLIEIAPHGATKGDALKYIFETFSYDRRALVAFGDGENDIEMLEYAKHGVAMKNGFEHVKNLADDIALSNDEDGVYYYLLSLVSQ